MKMITHKIFWLVLLISLACITNKVSAQFVPMQSAQYKHLAADTLYDFTGNGAPTIHPNSYKRVVTYFDSTNGIPYWHNPKTQTWVTISGGGGSGSDTAKLIQGWGTIISGENGFYAPNYPDVTITVDSNDIKTFVNEYVSNDTTVFHFDSSDVTFYVDSIVLAPPPSAVSGDKFLIGSPATGTFAGKTNQIAELVGAVYNYTIPDASNIGDIIAVQNGVLSYYKYNGATWVFQRSFPSWGGDYLGVNGDIGVKSNNSLNLLTNGIRQFTIDPAGDLYANNYKHIDTAINFLKVIDSATGKLGIGYFSPGPTWEYTLNYQGSTPFTTDNTVDFDGHYLVFDSLSGFDASGIGATYRSDLAVATDGGIGMTRTTDTSTVEVAIEGEGDAAHLSATNVTNNHILSVTPDSVSIYGNANGGGTVLKIPGLPVGSTSDSILSITTGGFIKKVVYPTGGGGSGTTDYQTITATASQTTFTFTGVPASYNDYIVFVWGIAATPITDYTTSGNIITFTTGLTTGSIVRFQRIK